MQIATEERLVHDFGNASLMSGAVLKTPEELIGIVSRFVSTDGWMERVRLSTTGRWYERLYHGPDYDIWAISWLPGQSTGFHDHGESSGAFVLATGELEEQRPGERPVVIHSGQPRGFGSDYAHDVLNVSLAPAVSIHAYSPPLNEMNEYELDGGRLVPRERASERAKALGKQALAEEWRAEWQRPANPTGGPASVMTIDQLLLSARARLRRLSPGEAYGEVVETGAVLVDIRPEGQREIEGNVPGALLVERNVLEWRFDPASSARLPIASDHDLKVIVFCSEGYTSSLAAAALQDIGLWRATDMVGGFQAWRAAGLPILAPGDH